MELINYPELIHVLAVVQLQIIKTKLVDFVLIVIVHAKSVMVSMLKIVQSAIQLVLKFIYIWKCVLIHVLMAIMQMILQEFVKFVLLDYFAQLVKLVV